MTLRTETLGNVVMRAGAVVIAAATALTPSLAAADAWILQSGFTARGEYNDNYFLDTVNKQSAFTATVSPFVTAARRTETSDVTAVATVGANKVWGLSDNTDYVSGRLGVNSSLQDDRSTWYGNLSFSRAPAFQNQVTARGTVLTLAYTNAAFLNGRYQYALTERWSIGTTAGGYGNWYDDIQSSGSALQDNRGYYAGGNVGYAFSARTQMTLSAAYAHYSSDITRSGSVAATLGVVHKFSPELTISASVGNLWTDIEVTQTALVCPTTPILCDTGVVPRLPVTSGNGRRDSGQLYGGNIAYTLSERTQFLAALTETVSPSSTGTIAKSDNARGTLSHRFSERLTGRLGVSYNRQVFPSGLSGLSTTSYYSGVVGASYLLAERWKLDAGYRYTRADYPQSGNEPQSNVVFVSIGYGWPGGSFTDWVGARLETQGLPGAGPVPLSDRSTVPPAAVAVPGAVDAESTRDGGPPPSSPEPSPFDQFTIP